MKYIETILNQGSLHVETNGNGVIDFDYSDQYSYSLSIEELEWIIEKAKKHQSEWKEFSTPKAKFIIGDAVCVSNGRNGNTDKVGVITKFKDDDAFIDFGGSIRDMDGNTFPDAYWCNLKFIELWR